MTLWRNVELKVSVTEEMFTCGSLFETQNKYILWLVQSDTANSFLSPSCLFSCRPGLSRWHPLILFCVSWFIRSAVWFISCPPCFYDIMNDIHTPLPVAQLPGSAAGRCWSAAAASAAGSTEPRWAAAVTPAGPGRREEGRKEEDKWEIKGRQRKWRKREERWTWRRTYWRMMNETTWEGEMETTRWGSGGKSRKDLEDKGSSAAWKMRGEGRKEGSREGGTL